MSALPPTTNQNSVVNAGAEKPSRLLMQLNQRLLNLSEQVSRLQEDIDGMASVVDDSGMQVSALVDNLAETQSSAQLQKRLSNSPNR